MSTINSKHIWLGLRHYPPTVKLKTFKSSSKHLSLFTFKYSSRNIIKSDNVLWLFKHLIVNKKSQYLRIFPNQSFDLFTGVPQNTPSFKLLIKLTILIELLIKFRDLKLVSFYFYEHTHCFEFFLLLLDISFWKTFTCMEALLTRPIN